MLKHKLVFGRF